MLKTTRVLIVEIHPMIVKGYISTLESIGDQKKIFIDIVNNSEEAYDKIQKTNSDTYDIIILGINSIEQNNNFGLGVIIRQQFPKIKTLVTSMLDSSHSILKILKSLAPNAFLVKGEITSENLKNAFANLMEGSTYYSKIVNNNLSKRQSDNIDDLDIKILYYLSIGEKMKNLPKHIPLSMPSIERRKRNLKLVFEIENGGNLELLNVAKNKGFI